MKVKINRKWAAVAVLGFVAAFIGASPIARPAAWPAAVPLGRASMHSAPTPTKHEVVPAAPLGAQSPPNIDADSVTLGQAGFVPSVINRSPGQVVIAVANRAGLESMHLVLTLQSGGGGTVIFDQQVPNTSNDFAVLENLQPGAYVLTEASNSQWSCTFNVATQ